MPKFPVSIAGRAVPLIVGGLLVLGLMLRLLKLDLMLYDFDEGVASIYALQLTQRGDFPLVGVRTSFGFYNPPLFIYLIAPAFMISTSPLVATGWLQVLGIGALAWLAHHLYRFGWRWGVVTLVLFAVLAPGPLFLTRRLWGHALIPFFSVGVVGCLLMALARPRPRTVSMAIPLLVAGAQQVHFSGALLGVNILLCIPLLRLKLNWRWFTAGVAIAVLTYAPYILHEYRTGFADVKSIFEIIGGRTTASRRSPQALWLAALHTLSDFGGATAFQENYDKFLAKAGWFIWVKRALAMIWIMAFGLAVLTAARCAAHRKPCAPTLRIGLIWTMVPLITFSVLRVVTVPAYWLVALPGPLLLLGWCIEELALWSARFGILCVKALAYAGMIFLLYIALHQLQAAEPDPRIVIYPSYREQLRVVMFISRSAPPEGAHVMQEGRGPSGGIDYQLLYLIAMVENGNSSRLRKTPGEAANVRQYIIHNQAKPLPPALQNRRPAVQFNLLEVYISPNPNVINNQLTAP